MLILTLELDLDIVKLKTSVLNMYVIQFKSYCSDRHTLHSGPDNSTCTTEMIGTKYT